jgi:adenylate cyclase
MSNRGVRLEVAEPAAPELPFSRFCETVGPVIEWLLRDGRHIRDTRVFLGELCERLVAHGLPLCRTTFHIRTLHPLILTTGFFWRPDGEGPKQNHREHGVQASPAYLNSPVRIVYEERRAVRRRLDAPGARLDFPILEELKAEGVTDYLAIPAPFSDGRAACITMSTDRPGGFTEAEVAELHGLVPLVGLVLEVQATRQMARTILETYLGPRTGARVLRGQIKRGDAEAIQAVLWYCDLRGFTQLADSRGSDQLLTLLNGYFERMTAPVVRHGGEVLKFMGDAMLAIFPLDQEADTPLSCGAALEAAEEALAAMREFNRSRTAAGDPPLKFGIALHVGEVVYGNIGAPDRLDFTVIGPAVNEVARLEALCKALDRELVVSEAFVGCGGGCSARLQSLGVHALRGVRRPEEVFTLSDREPVAVT